MIGTTRDSSSLDRDPERGEVRSRGLAQGRAATCMVIPPGNDPHIGKRLDLEMLVMAGGHERSEAEFRDLLAAAGLRLTRIVPTASPICVIEGVAKEST